MTLKIDNAIEEIERALAGNKPKYANDIYLKNAIRYLQEIKSPSLTDDQQVVLDWFKNEKKTQPFATVADFFAAYFEGTEEEVPLNTMVSFEQLTTAEQFQVLAVFAEWGMEQEDKE